MLRLAEGHQLLPIIVFSFSRMECEAFAMGCYLEGTRSPPHLDFTTHEEKEAIEVVCNIIKFLCGVHVEMKERRE
jgi:superfamily II RNA helicase